MRDHAGAIRAQGADLAAIGTGDVAHAAEVKASQSLDFPLLVDPELTSYGEVGAGKGTAAALLRPGQVVSGLRALRSGARLGRPGQHPFMLGATHVIAPDGTVPYAWVNDDFGDNAPVADVVAALAGGHAAA